MGRKSQIESFMFRDLHPAVAFGTASDRYAGWLGQIYPRERFEHQVTGRTKKVGGKSFKESLLPVESVEAYFNHFSFLEIDFTFYSPLLNKDFNPTRAYESLGKYTPYVSGERGVILKVPQAVSARKLWRGKAFIENPDFLIRNCLSGSFMSRPSISWAMH